MKPNVKKNYKIYKIWDKLKIKNIKNQLANFPSIALIGYTNAVKSALMNCMVK